MVREGPAQRLPSDYEADKGRGGGNYFAPSWQRYAFIGGLVGALLLVIILGSSAAGKPHKQPLGEGCSAL